jgi:type II secretory pathway component PulC
MSDNILPEEKLLKLIRGQGAQNGAADMKPAGANSTIATEQKSGLKFSLRPLMIKYLFLFRINRIIPVIFIAFCVYLLASFLYPFLFLREIKLPQITPEKIPEQGAGVTRNIKPYEYYIQGIPERNVFGNLSAPQGQVPETSRGGVNSDLTKDLNLLGIISGENPQAVIEDKNSQKTYYLNKNQSINDFVIEDIQEGRVILNYKGQRYELNL